MGKLDPQQSAMPFIETGNPTENVSTGLTVRQELAARFVAAILSERLGCEHNDQIVKYGFDTADAFIRVNNQLEGE